jgi:tetratricopeptide (TPR) repeat protein
VLAITKFLARLLVVSALSGCAGAVIPPPGRPQPSAAPLLEPAVAREHAAEDIRAWRFGPAKEELDRVLAVTPNDPVAHLYYGELCRLEAQHAGRPEDRTPLLEQARQAYERAAALDPAYPDPFRQLGFLYYQSGNTEKAKDAFRKYLALKPDAPDARRVTEYLEALDR